MIRPFMLHILAFIVGLIVIGFLPLDRATKERARIGLSLGLVAGFFTAIVVLKLIP